MAEFEIKKIVEAANSYKALPYPKGLGGLPEYYFKRLAGTKDRLFKDKNDLLGRPLILPVRLGGIWLGGGTEGALPIQPVVEINMSKKIVRTGIPGHENGGKVKEYIGIDDYQIKIDGVLAAPSYPFDQWEKLKDFWLKNETISFESDLTIDLFDRVVIEKMKLHDLRAGYKVQRYEIFLSSDAELELEIVELL